MLFELLLVIRDILWLGLEYIIPQTLGMTTWSFKNRWMLCILADVIGAVGLADGYLIYSRNIYIIIRSYNVITILLSKTEFQNHSLWKITIQDLQGTQDWKTATEN